MTPKFIRALGTAIAAAMAWSAAEAAECPRKDALGTSRVLVVDAIAPEGLAYLRERGFQVDELRKPSPEELHAALAECEALVTRSGTAVTAELLA